MNLRKRLWIKIGPLFLFCFLFSPMAYAAPSDPGTGQSTAVAWYSAHAQAVAVTAITLLLILLVVFVFLVGAEKVARKIYELIRIAVMDSSGRVVVVTVFAVIAAGVGF